jgi:microcin C transport system substrate-binding protein
VVGGTRPPLEIGIPGWNISAMRRLANVAAVVLVFTVVRNSRAWAADAGSAGGQIAVGHGLSMYGDLKYGPGFTHFDYTNPNALKGGDVKLAAIGTFDSLNPFILKGVAATGIGDTFDTLMEGSSDEPFSEYGLIAESVEVPADRSWVAFTLRPEACFHDGSPITADDVIWTFDTLKSKGHPFYRSYYSRVMKAEKLGLRKVRFSFSPGDNRELPLIVGQLPVLSKTYWSTHDFDKTTLEPPLGSGPYRVASVEPGRSIVYRRAKDYWAANLPVRAGRFNFDTIRYDYYRDTTVALEAFKAGQYDFREENMAKNWATGYDIPAVAAGLIKKKQIPNEVPTGMQAYVYNTRRAVFQDRRVREALGYAFDFDWTNKYLFYGAYTRTKSYFSNSELASRGLPSRAELEILDPFRGQGPEAVFTKEYEPPETDGSGEIRSNLIRALKLLEEAGWTIKDMRLVKRSGEPMQFEILLADPSFERVTLPFAENLKRLGITARVRTVDTAQYQNRVDNFDFDMTVANWPESLSPGNEQIDYWTSQRADVPGSRNLAGIKDPVVDKLVDLVIAAGDRQSLVDRTRALDRVLLWGQYVIPQWHITAFRVAYWDRFARPGIAPKYALGFDTWWVDAAKEAALMKRKGELFK